MFWDGGGNFYQVFVDCQIWEEVPETIPTKARQNLGGEPCLEKTHVSRLETFLWVGEVSFNHLAAHATSLGEEVEEMDQQSKG